MGARKWTLASHKSTDALSFDQLEKCFSLCLQIPPNLILLVSTNSKSLQIHWFSWCRWRYAPDVSMSGELATWVVQGEETGNDCTAAGAWTCCWYKVICMVLSIQRREHPNLIAPTNLSLVWCHVLLSLAECWLKTSFPVQNVEDYTNYKTFSKPWCAVLPL